MDPNIARAQAGDRQAIEDLIRSVQDQVFGLSLRMLWNEEDAKDATQEILLKIITKLSTFKGESRFSTWCHAVASRHLLNCRRSRAEAAGFTFEAFSEDLLDGAEEPGHELRSRPEYSLMLNEVMIGCTLGMLLCLDREHRLAYVLGTIFDVDHNEGAVALGISRDAFRKRLSRANQRIHHFTRSHCGLVDGKNACRCPRRLSPAVKLGRVAPAKLQFAGRGEIDFQEVKPLLDQASEELKTVRLYRAHPRFQSPEDFGRVLESILSS